MLELGAANEIVRLNLELGTPGSSRALLEQILAAIEGGEGTRDVQNARALLAELPSA